MERIRLLLICVSFVMYVLMLVSVPLRKKIILKRAGRCILKIRKNRLFMQVVAITFAGLLLALLFIRNLGSAGNVIICLVSILATAMSSEEIALNDVSGLYENGIIADGHFLMLSEIFAIPALSYSKEEQERQNANALVIQTDKRGVVTFAFPTPRERDAVLDGLLKLNPNLAR